MEYVKPGYVAPTYPVQPMPLPAPMPMPVPKPIMTMPIYQQPAPIIQKPVHNDIHLHASYQHSSFIFPKPAAVAPVAVKSCHPYTSPASILVLFILLVIITRGFIPKC
ncbi:hypothetical protein [Paenibacillus sp. SI8]|uniref:hypothetical protein n=1 Tax=unclassified Paenibacillus TaxID=185978 RepID=UPI0034655D63